MELREYGRILLRHWWLLLLLPLLVGIFSVVTYQEPSVTYGYRLQYTVSFIPTEGEELSQDPTLSAVQASEYIADDLTEILRGSTFASYVEQYLPDPAPSVNITSVIRTVDTHREVEIDLSASTSEEAEQLGTAVKQAVENDLLAQANDWWGTLRRMRFILVDDSGAFPISSGLRSQLDVPLRVAIALAAAVALAFAIDYLDDSVRSREEAERLVGRVLGEIPK
jgi:capsular polysaccharide biosynthesis protein